MTEQELLEIATRVAVIMLYVIAFVMGIVSIHRSDVWARRRSGIAISIASFGWLAFYIWVVDQSFREVETVVLTSRIVNYVNASMLIVMAWNIITAARFEDTIENKIYLVLDEVSHE